MNITQKQAIREVLSMADAKGLTTSWEPGTDIEVIFPATKDTAWLLVVLEELELSTPGYVTVRVVDPVVRHETTAPVATVRLTSRIRDLVKDGYFHG
jgi:hypothetical protein